MKIRGQTSSGGSSRNDTEEGEIQRSENHLCWDCQGRVHRREAILARYIKGNRFVTEKTNQFPEKFNL